ncbi:MAG: LysE family translocator [Amylibacter sp.]|jgi:threonine/homoserine/homoserine lactone efflux protein|nr:LysE family translocator [Amylibacter sp.]
MWDVLTSFDPAVLLAFIGAGLLLNITPGVDFVFVSASGISGGPKTGMAAALGVNLGVAVHIVLAAAGVSALLLAYPAAYDAIRYIGAAYLIFLAVQAWRATGDVADGRAAQSLIAAVKRGFLTNVLNPKTALFIFAFIPQFTDPAIGPIWMQILILGAIFLLFGFAFSLTLGVAAGVFSNALRTRVKFLNKITAILFGGLAAKLVLD